MEKVKPLVMMLGDPQTGRGRLVRWKRFPVRPATELLEPRQMLTAAPIQFGAVYVEQDLGSDASPDVIEISFTGGADGTQLSKIELDADQFTPGLSLADMIFDTETAGLGVDLSFNGAIASRVGDFTATIHVEDGSSKLVIEFEGFDADEKMVLAVDVDEVQGFDPNETDLAHINEELDPIASGAEFQGTQYSVFFSAPHYHHAEGSAEFRNRYDDQLADTQLDLPADDHDGQRDRTAGAVGILQQRPLPVSISGRVFEDNNGDLQAGTEDQGLEHVELSLFVESQGQFVFTGETVLTDAAGDYSFASNLDLLPGTYQVRETQPEGYFSVGAVAGTVAGTASGVVETPDILGSIEIPLGGQAAINYDFAEARLASIRGQVILSTSDDSCWGGGAHTTPASGVTVLLLDEVGQQLAETQTDDDGNYEFLDLRPGIYTVVEVTPSNLISGSARAGTVDGERTGITNDDRITQIRLASGADALQYDFCDHPPASLSGTVYHDRDNDGLQDVGEEGIAGAILSLLDEEGLTVDSVESDVSGRYEFVGLRSGNYRVIEMQPQGWLDGKDRAGHADGRRTGRAINPGDEIADIRLFWGDDATEFDFGELQPSRIDGRVHLSDSDGDCWDIEEELLEPVAGAVVQLLDATGQVLAEVVTDADGNYVFDELAPGDYGVREITPIGLHDGGSRAGEVDEAPTGSVATDGTITEIRLSSDQTATNYDFCEHRPGTLSGYVFDDRNADGELQPSDLGIAGVTLELLDHSGKVIDTTETDDVGRYEFTGLTLGTYSVRQIHPEGYIDSLDSAGTVDGQTRGAATNPGDLITDISLGWGQSGIHYNFSELRPASLSGTVHASPLESCWEDSDAIPLGGVRILLADDQGHIVAETQTSSSGSYEFNGLSPGVYTVLQEQPDSVFDGGQRAGSHGGDATFVNEINGVPLAPGQQAVDYDFCERPASTISGFVFVDGEPIPLRQGEELPDDISSIRDGELTSDDQPLAGVELELRHGITGIAVTSNEALPGRYPEGPIRTVTDANGYYVFDGLKQGNYSVYEIHPDGFIDGIDTPGTADGIAINPLPPDSDEIFLETVVSSLAVSPRNDAIVRIGLPPGVHSEWNNFSEVLTVARLDWAPWDPPPASPIPPAVDLTIPELYQRSRDLPPAPLEERPFHHDGSSGAVSHSWHLSVIDGGHPRVELQPAATMRLFPTWIWQQATSTAGVWNIHDADLDRDLEYYFGIPHSLPITGDFNGDGETEIGVFADGHWFIDINGNGSWDGHDLWARLGQEGDTPVVGDWDGDGKDDIGIFGKSWPGDTYAVRHEHGLPDIENAPDGARKNMPPTDTNEVVGYRAMKHSVQGRLRQDVIDHVFLFGNAGDVGVVGDWNGDGIDTIGLFQAGIWKLDVDGNGRWTDPDESYAFGRVGDQPIVGDFNGDGIDELGVVRDGVIYIDANGNHKIDANDLVIRFDQSHQRPVVGNWGAHGADAIGFFKNVGAEKITVASRAETE